MTDTETRTPSAVYRAFARFLRFVYGKWWKAKHQLLSPRAIRSIDSTAEWAIALTVVAKASLEAAAANWGGMRYVLYGTWAAVALLGVSKAAQVTLGRRRPILEDVEQIRHTQDRLDHFRDEAASVKSKAELKRLTLAYVQGLLGSVCKAFGRPGETRASIMLEEKDALVLRYIYPLPPRLDTDWAFSLPVRDRRASGRTVLQDEAIGAAGYAYWGLDTVCVPRISLRTGYWVVRKEDGQLEQSKIHYPVWVEEQCREEVFVPGVSARLRGT